MTEDLTMPPLPEGLPDPRPVVKEVPGTLTGTIKVVSISTVEVDLEKTTATYPFDSSRNVKSLEDLVVLFEQDSENIRKFPFSVTNSLEVAIIDDDTQAKLEEIRKKKQAAIDEENALIRG